MKVCYLLLTLLLANVAAADDALDKLAGELKLLDTQVLPKAEREAARERLGRQLDAEIKQANTASRAAWQKIASRGDWEKFRAEKLAKLKASLRLPQQRLPVEVHSAGDLKGDGYSIKKIIYATRPQWYVTANLYLPEKSNSGMPGIIISHSHHSPKTQGELQDMGATWARAGCAVLVPDHLGHGERREHPFASAKDYAQEFPVGRQDYHFRYDASLQLYLSDESLMGWLVHDLMGGVDVLLALPGIDKQKIILLGGVAGGGDPAAVAGAVDERINCVGPFNFGGPQPETRYPLPEDAETWFNYAGGGSWESTRNLADSAKDGFLPWVIVGSIAPRKLIYGHEFSWDKERDPVWKRFEKIWGFYDAKTSLAVAHGKGNLKGQEPESSHCGNIGAFHRRMIHPLLAQWYGIASTPDTEFSQRHSAAELACWTAALQAKLKPKSLHEVLREQTRSMAKLGTLADVRQAWQAALQLPATESPQAKVVGNERLGDVRFERVRLQRDVTLLLMFPASAKVTKSPLVLAVAQQGKAKLLKTQAVEFASLLMHGVAVGLVDIAGTGETSDDDDQGQNSAGTSYSATALMLGRPLLGQQLADLRLALTYCRERKDVAADRIGLWGDSLAKADSGAEEFRYPRRVSRPSEATPLGPTLVMLLALEVPEIRSIYTRGGLVSFASVLDSQFVQIPHAQAVPGVMKTGDLGGLAAALAPRPLLIQSPVTGENRMASKSQVHAAYAQAADAYAKGGQAASFQSDPQSTASPLEFFQRTLLAK